MWRKILGLGMVVVVASIAIVILSEITRNGDHVNLKSRQETLPTDIVKGTPETDYFPPILQSDDWYAPIPLPGPINTVGAEDSPFLTPDGQWFFFFFTPDVRVPVEKQLIDGVTGIWWSKKEGDDWTEPERVVLNDGVSLDGAEFIQDDTMWFASVRAGNYREIDIYTAKYDGGKWADVANAGEQLNVQYDIGEFCLSPDGKTLYFGSGNTTRDIWSLKLIDGSWGNLTKVANVNSDDLSEDQPFVTADGIELWFTGQSRKGYPGPAVYRSTWNGTTWSQPIEIISRFAGEPTLDGQGNIYFVHHFFSQDGTMIEADIYVAYRKVLTDS